METTRRPLVLVIEDDPDLSAFTCEVLELEGFATSAARHGAHALRQLEGGLVPAVVVCDMMMPELDGFGFLAAYARRPPPRAPVLAVSAFEPYLEQAMPAGAAAALAKPYDLERFLATVRSLAQGRTPAPAGRREPAPLRLDERTRLEAVLRLALEARSPGEALQQFAERVARIFDVPVALVSIVTADRQVWHAACGLPADLAQAGGGPRDESFCTHAVAARAALVVQDTHANPFFAHNALVRTRGLRFYAGVPIFARTGEAIGTLCLLDFAARAFGYFDLELLGALARRVMGELEQRERASRPGAPEAGFPNAAAWDAELDLLGRDTFRQALTLESLRALERRQAVSVAVGAFTADGLRATVSALKARLPRAHLGRLGHARIGVVDAGGSVDALRAELLAVGGAGARVVAADLGRVGDAGERLAWLEATLGEDGLTGRGGRS
jgi:CheY-like chemotaxis protein